MDTSRIVALVMAGGSGTRFWPCSRRNLPKQFLSFGAEESLLAATVRRLDGLIPRERVFVITGVEHAALAEAHAGVPAANVIAEPEGRDTAACIGVGALVARQLREDAVLVVLSADHLVGDEKRFRDALHRAATLAADSGAIVNIGMRPDRPATGYGYVEIGECIDSGDPPGFRVRSFREKPDSETAARFVLGGDFLWNSGIFAFSVSTILAELQQHLPELHRDLLTLRDPRSFEELKRVYPTLQKISIDYGVMEHATNRIVVEANFDWDDMGTFEAVARHATVSVGKNLARGDAVFHEAHEVLVINDAPGTVVVSGVQDLLVVRTGETVLVMRRKDAERVKDVVKALEARGLTHLL
ncbi:MAG: mannose-1-phosphate guanylyltransferase [Planctomycetes bacterium]|nr:mannose-1-phosphate guanylyltransferase [Planctomycetota bacterium]